MDIYISLTNFAFDSFPFTCVIMGICQVDLFFYSMSLSTHNVMKIFYSGQIRIYKLVIKGHDQASFIHFQEI